MQQLHTHSTWYVVEIRKTCETSWISPVAIYEVGLSIENVEFT